MDDTLCDVNHLDADVLLPPRKRLLAGIKKQSLNVGEGSSSPSLPSCSSSWPSSVFKACPNSLMSAHSNSSSLMLMEIVEASQSAAVTAADIGKAARAAAEEKAAIAAWKFAAAKSALDLVASFSEEGINDGSHLRRSKLNKQVPVCSLYRGRPRKVMSSMTDEEIAQKLHRVMNSSPRILKNPTPSSDYKYTQRKIHDVPHNSHGNGFAMVPETSRIGCNGHAIAGEVDSDGYAQATSDNDEKVYKKSRYRKLRIDKDKVMDEKHMTTGKKRGRVKLKRLPLSICTSKVRANLKDDGFAKNVSVRDVDNANGVRGCVCFVDSSGDGTKKAAEVKKTIDSTTTPFWRCQEFGAPALCQAE